MEQGSRIPWLFIIGFFVLSFLALFVSDEDVENFADKNTYEEYEYFEGKVISADIVDDDKTIMQYNPALKMSMPTVINDTDYIAVFEFEGKKFKVEFDSSNELEEFMNSDVVYAKETTVYKENGEIKRIKQEYSSSPYQEQIEEPKENEKKENPEE